MIYVDELRHVPFKATPMALRKIARLTGGRWCHLTADTEEELHEFALSIGLERPWAQVSGSGVVHYALTPAKRQQAISEGAQFVRAADQARQRKEAGESAKYGVRSTEKSEGHQSTIPNPSPATTIEIREGWCRIETRRGPDSVLTVCQATPERMAEQIGNLQQQIVADRAQ